MKSYSELGSISQPPAAPITSKQRDYIAALCDQVGRDVPVPPNASAASTLIHDLRAAVTEQRELCRVRGEVGAYRLAL